MKSFHQICLIYKAKLQGSNWLARCPAHDDEEPSLAIEEGAGGRTLFKCHAGCRTEDVLSAKGLDWGDVLPDESVSYWNPVGGASEKVWVIRDLGGAEVARHIRRGKKGGGKVFSWERNGSPGLKGLAGKDLPLYGCEKVRGYSAAKSIFVVEGEKACDACWELGLQAVGTVTGAAGTPSSVTLAVLKGFKVILWPDFDAVGVAHMERIAAKLEGRASSVRWVAFRDSKGCDAADYRGDQEGLKRLIQSKAPEIPSAEVVEFERVEKQDTRFEKVAQDEYRLSTELSELALRSVRTERGETVGELEVRTSLPGAVTVNGTLYRGRFSVSAGTTRKSISKSLADLFKGGDYRADYWHDLINELCILVLREQERPEPVRLISELEDPGPEWNCGVMTRVIPLLPEDPTILFGAKASLKTYLMILMAGDLTKAGHRVLIIDYEGNEHAHKARFGEVFGSVLPNVLYYRPRLLLYQDAPNLRRIVRENKVTYAMVDSISMAASSIEESESAQLYGFAARSLGIGMLHLAHVTKSSHPDSKLNPFGSSMWGNFARSMWYIEKTDRTENSLTVALHHRKSSSGPELATRALMGRWAKGEFWIEGAEYEDREAISKDRPSGGTAKKMFDRLESVGPMTILKLAQELKLARQAVHTEAKRKRQFFIIENGYIRLHPAGDEDEETQENEE